MRFSLLCLLAANLASVLSEPASEERVTFDGVRVLRVPTPAIANVLEIEKLVAELHLETWSDGFSVGEPVDVLVPADKLERFTDVISDFSVMHEDLGASIRAESPNDFAIAAASPDLSFFNAYHVYDDHLSFLTQVQAKFPNNSEIIRAPGASVQGRNITGIHIFGSSGKGTKPAVIWHGGIHAREWISPKTAEYLAYQLLNNYANSTEVKALVDAYDFYVLPIVNPDGFVYSQTTNRNWRKNRQAAPSGSTCIGRDLNRNWPVQWNRTNCSGCASTSPCAEDYKGLAAGDAPEIQALVAFSRNIAAANPIVQYIDFHSYGQYFLYAWGYTCTVHPQESLHRSTGNAFATAVRAKYSKSYTVGGACAALYPTTGSSDDYHTDIHNVTHSYTIELRDTGTYGFVLPASQIQATGEETWAGLLAILKLL